MADRLEDLSAAGVSIWLDDLSRKLLATGGLGWDFPIAPRMAWNQHRL